MNESMNFSLITSEIFLLAAICVIMIVDLFQRDKERVLTFTLSQIALIVLVVIGFNELGEIKVYGFDQHWVVDDLSRILKLSIYIVSIVALFYARPFISYRNLMRGEYYLLWNDGNGLGK